MANETKKYLTLSSLDTFTQQLKTKLDKTYISNEQFTNDEELNLLLSEVWEQGIFMTPYGVIDNNGEYYKNFTYPFPVADYVFNIDPTIGYLFVDVDGDCCLGLCGKQDPGTGVETLFLQAEIGPEKESMLMALDGFMVDINTDDTIPNSNSFVMMTNLPTFNKIRLIPATIPSLPIHHDFFSISSSMLETDGTMYFDKGQWDFKKYVTFTNKSKTEGIAGIEIDGVYNRAIYTKATETDATTGETCKIERVSVTVENETVTFTNNLSTGISSFSTTIDTFTTINLVPYI